MEILDRFQNKGKENFIPFIHVYEYHFLLSVSFPEALLLGEELRKLQTRKPWGT